MNIQIPVNYDPVLDVRTTQEAIKYIRDTFQKELGKELGLSRISAPLFVPKSTGLNDNLNGIERPVSFDIQEMPGERIEVVQSLAKWKRYALKKYGFNVHEGLYTNMNAIRRDELLDNLHSVYVDQWDWEKVIDKKERTTETLEATAREIFKVIKHMEHEVWYKYPEAVCHLADDVFFITSQELEDMYPDLTVKEREDAITKEKQCVFIKQIGKPLKRSGRPHDGRAPDYDDWDLNGDLLFWLPSLGRALGNLLHGHPRGRKLHRHTVQGFTLRRKTDTALPPDDPEPRTALHHRRRHRTEQTVHAPAEQGAHRRSPGIHLA